MKKFLKIIVFVLSLVLFMSPAFLLFSCCSPQSTTSREMTKDSTTIIEIKHVPISVQPDVIHADNIPLIKKNDSIQTAEKETPAGTLKAEVNTKKGTIKMTGIPVKKDTTVPVENRTTNVNRSEKEKTIQACSKDHTTFWGDFKKVSIGAVLGIILISAIWLYIKFKVNILQRIKHLW